MRRSLATLPHTRPAAWRWLSLGLAASLLGACSGDGGRRIVVNDAVCISPVPPRRTPLPQATPQQRQALQQAGFSPEAAHMADIIGATPSLLALVRAERAPADRTGQVLAQQQLNLSINRAILEVQGTLATLACQGARIDQLQFELSQRESDLNRRLALAGIFVGATTAVVAGGLGFLATSTAANIAGIVGGSAGAALSAAQLDVAATGRLRLQQNMLEEFWRGPETPTLFPARVWRYLTWRAAPGLPTERERIMAEWRASGLVPDENPTPDPPDIILERGRLGTDDLQTLKAILEPFEVRIGLMARDLGRLIEELLERQPAPQR